MSSIDKIKAEIDSLPEEEFVTINWTDGDDDGLRDYYHDSTSSVYVSY